jgi:hypothetical protein
MAPMAKKPTPNKPIDAQDSFTQKTNLSLILKLTLLSND